MGISQNIGSAIWENASMKYLVGIDLNPDFYMNGA
jgi:hypothetical protein